MAERPINFTRKAAQRIGQAVRHVERSRAGGATGGHGVVPRGDVVRMKVTAADVAPSVVLAKIYDGTQVTGLELAVRVYWMREVDDEIYAYVPAGGTGAMYEGDKVLWLEVYKDPTPEFQGQAMVAVSQNAMGLDFIRAVALPGV